MMKYCHYYFYLYCRCVAIDFRGILSSCMIVWRKKLRNLTAAIEIYVVNVRLVPVWQIPPIPLVPLIRPHSFGIVNIQRRLRVLLIVYKSGPQSLLPCACMSSSVDRRLNCFLYSDTHLCHILAISQDLPSCPEMYDALYVISPVNDNVS